jgi:hypothetical protein
MGFNNIFQNTFVYLLAGGGQHIDLFQQVEHSHLALAVLQL